mmetsp:Transcript_52160/g.113046  ORF Transcript_52160/g.113046 Transcript_52160/m.113046 type:complete len:278 (-) Transcript_52160:58-891(-)
MATAVAISHHLDPNAPAFMMPLSAEAQEFLPVADALGQSLRAEAAEFIPMVGGWATLQAATEALQQKQKRQMPYATDEEWEARVAKREKEVETIKSLQSYKLYVEAFPHDKRRDDDPKTPDPRDRTVSKRMWKWNVEKWRLQLKGWASPASSSAPASAEGPTAVAEAAAAAPAAPCSEALRVYSRNVCLQCRDFIQRHAEAQSPPAGSEVDAAGSDGAPAAKPGQRPVGHIEAVPVALLKKGLPVTLPLPELPGTAPLRESGRGAVRASVAGTGVFQ